MSNFHTIVVGVDFSACAASALRAAIRLSSPTSAVHAIHVIDALLVERSRSAPSPLRQGVETYLTEQSEQSWRDFSSTIEGADRVRFSTVIAPRTEALRDAAMRHGADLLIVGAYGERRPNVGMGTMASACLRHAEVPVLIVRERHSSAPGEIAAFVDFSEISRHAVRLAAAVARAEGARLRAVHFYDAPWRRLVYLSATPIVDPEFDVAQIAELKRRLRTFVDETFETAAARSAAVDSFFGRDVAVDVVDRPGGHRLGIAEYVEAEHIDLVVLGTRSDRRLRDAFLGSTAERVIRDVSASILATSV